MVKAERRLFVSFAYRDGFGWGVLDDVVPPRNPKEIKDIQNKIEQLKGLSGVGVTIMNWIEIRDHTDAS